MSKRDHIQGALRNHGIIFFVFGVLMAFGIWALPQMSKDERVDAICSAGKGAAHILEAGRKYVAAETEEQRELKLGTLNFRISQQAKANAFRS